MIQTPITQSQPVKQPKCHPPIVLQPSYNAVKIDIHNPQVNTPGYNPQSEPVTAPMYSYPEKNVYDVPKQSVYEPKEEPKKESKPEQKQEQVTQPPAVKEVPVVPPPVIVQPPTAPVASAQVETPKVESPKVETPKAESPKVDAVPVAQKTEEVKKEEQKVETAEVKEAKKEETKPETPIAPPQTVEVKAPEAAKPEVDLNAFILKLTNPDFEVQANTMETIADMAQNSPQKATELLDVKVIDSLLGIMQSDTSKLVGPSQKQLEIRDKIMTGKPVTEAETAEANIVSPMEQAERNKQYAMYTVAILQKLYSSEIEKMNNTVVPLTELPGSAGIVEQVKNNPNPMVRVAGIDALSYIQRPEYKQDLNTIFNVAKNDKDVNVQKAATKALEKLTSVADAPVAPTPVVTDAKPAASTSEAPKETVAQASVTKETTPQPKEEVKSA